MESRIEDCRQTQHRCGAEVSLYLSKPTSQLQCPRRVSLSSPAAAYPCPPHPSGDFSCLVIRKSFAVIYSSHSIRPSPLIIRLRSSLVSTEEREFKFEHPQSPSRHRDLVVKNRSPKSAFAQPRYLEQVLPECGELSLYSSLPSSEVNFLLS